MPNAAGSRPDAVGTSSPEVADRIERLGARVLLLDGSGRLLLVRGHDPHQPERSFWFTPGGGIEAGESPREAAVRELAEETGYVLEPGELVGPVWLRTAVFDFASRPYTQHEQIFVGLLADAERRPRAGVEFTADEHEALDEVTWLSHAEVAAEPREVFPDVLREPWDWFVSWDGVPRNLGVQPE
ncbi:NUDIX hydrolase [Demequina sp.]|uniref:NUDIX hydrolase n=1 Tax=Demequina sp. TaxID=2050685 RepID=UPI003D105E2F